LVDIEAENIFVIFRQSRLWLEGGARGWGRGGACREYIQCCHLQFYISDVFSEKFSWDFFFFKIL